MATGSFDDRYTEYQTDRSPLRKWVRKAYLASARGKLRGPVLDFGCGVGELLATLPAGSMGLEYNRATVDYCRESGLDVDWYDGMSDDWGLTTVADSRRFESMVISHVLEHLDMPTLVLRRLLSASERIGIRRVLVCVPGRAGFHIDDTHRTFIDREMLSNDDVVAGTGFQLREVGYFPGNLRAIGNWFPHHELQAIFVKD